jgi:hypothetical protein
MERDAKGEACVIPVILRAVNWKDAPFGNLQPLPKNAEPVTNWSNRDQALADVAEGIRRAVKELTRKKDFSPPAAKPASPKVDSLIEELSPLFIAGPPIGHPRYFFGRQREIGRIFNPLKRLPLQNAGRCTI